MPVNKNVPLALVLVVALALAACGDGGDNRATLDCSFPFRAPRAIAPSDGLGGQLVWASDRGGNGDLYAVSLATLKVRRLTNMPDNEILPAWSPDGARLACVSLQGEDFANPGVFVMNADGSDVRALTRPEPDVGGLAWSPDRTRIAFAQGDDIHEMRADGSQRHRLTDHPAFDGWLSWSPNEKVLFTSDRDGIEELWTMRPDGSSPTRLTDGLAAEAAWSPDGASAAFVSSRDGNPGANDPIDWNEEIYVTPADGSRVTHLTRIPGNDHWTPSWPPTGDHIAFTSDGCSGRDSGRESDIYITDARGSTLLNATHHPSLDAFPAWQPQSPRPGHR